MPAPQALVDLVSRFEEQLEAYKSGAYNETQLRIDFLDPFFSLLGWDMQNTSGHAEAYRDVIHEDEVRVGGALKAPDYGFRIGGTRKFFLEAKKPSVAIRDEIQPAYQLRRYAWSAKLPLSILSDFEEFAIYDCRIKPKPNDKASTARLFYCTYRDYVEKWDEIAAIFSKDAILKGSFDKYASSKGRRGTAEVDGDFLATIEVWRSDLAQDLAKRNPSLTERDLNFAVQKIIDRIIFLRICEDRGMEDYGRLRALTSGPRIYPRLTELFRAADTRYNSGLFHFQPEKGRDEGPDELTLDLEVDDKLLRDLLKQLYYPESPYEFRVLSSDILGQVYEQFLGKVIRLTPSHKAKVENKPEVKKAGGVYYTPTYIVDYIVRETVGVLIEGKTPKQIASIRVLDPACGSGSFLIGAYQFLLDWYLKYYTDHEPVTFAKGKRPVLIQTPGGWRLSIEERKRILLAHIHGVDIDSQAVEVTKLSLLLKVLEGETSQSLQPLFQIFHERALPDLGNNIKCGNSLIGSDFYAQPDLPLLSDEEKMRINVFDWSGPHGFQKIMKEGGFHAIIGNPPYIFARELMTPLEKEYYTSHYKLSWEKQNTFMLFMEALLQLLNATGRGGLIVPNSWLTIESARLLRQEYIRKLESVADLNYAVFPQVAMEPCVFILSGKTLEQDAKIVRANSKNDFLAAKPSFCSRNVWNDSENRIILSSSNDISKLLDAIISKSAPLELSYEVKTGLQAYEQGKGTPPQTKQDVLNHVFDRTSPEDENSFRYLEGRDVTRFGLSWSGLWMQYGPWLSQPREIGLFTRPRVLLREITAPLPYCLYAAYTADPYLNNKSILNILHQGNSENKLKALTCILNSKLLALYYKNNAVKGARKIFPKVVIKNLREFPIPKVIDPVHIEQMASLADTESRLIEQLKITKNPYDKSALKSQITATDVKIDHLVYTLYGLTEEEIRIVEAAA